MGEHHPLGALRRSRPIGRLFAGVADPDLIGRRIPNMTPTYVLPLRGQAGISVCGWRSVLSLLCLDGGKGA